MLDKTTEDTKGDIAQLGVAAAVTISSGGEAMSKTIDSWNANCTFIWHW